MSAGDRARGPGYPYFVLGVLFLVSVFNFVDRQLVSVLLQPIKDEFQVSDAWMGALTGFAFMIVHSVVGIPLARWADRGDRRLILTLGLTVWSALTVASGLVRQFGTLLFARMGVGIGEAAGTPTAHSMISDYFPPERRATALAVYAMGVYVGIMFGYIAAGWLGQNLGWRLTFMVVGAPGLLIALLMYWAVDEPPRTTTVESHPLREVVSYLVGKPAYVILLAAASFHAAAAYCIAQWAPTFLLRVHHMSLIEVGLSLGLVTGVSGAAGTLVGGMVSDRLARANRAGYAWTTAFAALGSLPFAIGFVLSDDAYLALAWFAPMTFLTGMYIGPLYAMNQGLARPRMRATAVAAHLFVVSILGGGVGPWVVGLLNDAFQAEYGDAGIRQSLVWVQAVCLSLAGACYLLVSLTLDRDMEGAES
ncbi:MAG: spinster family MFS transporter [Myxococcota bacterium]